MKANRPFSSSLTLVATVVAICVVLALLVRDRYHAKVQRTEAELSADLDQQVVILRRRIEAKNEVLQSMLRGELTLFQAAAWFRFLDQGPPFHPDYRLHFQGETEEELLCRQVIHWAVEEHSRINQRSQGEEYGCLLELQLWQHKEQHGRVVLPDLDCSVFHQ